MRNESGQYVFFDLETTGLDFPSQLEVQEAPEQDEIIQIAAIATGRAPDFQEVDRFEVKLYPSNHGLGRMERGFERSGFKHRFDKNLWLSVGHPATTGLKMFKEFLSRHVQVTRTSKTGGKYKIARVAGHNINSFDVNFLLAYAKKKSVFMPIEFRGLDTLSVIPWLKMVGVKLPEVHTLGSLCEHYGIELKDAHDALADVSANVELARRFARELADW